MAAASGFSTITGATTLSAIMVRKAVDTKRMQAKDLIEYRIADHKKKLEPVGRLDVLDCIRERELGCYDAQDVTKLPDDTLTRQARARQILGQVALNSDPDDDAK